MTDTMERDLIEATARTVVARYQISLLAAEQIVQAFLDRTVEDHPLLWDEEHRHFTPDGLVEVSTLLRALTAGGIDDQLIFARGALLRAIGNAAIFAREWETARNMLIHLAMTTTTYPRSDIAEQAMLKEARLYQIRDAVTADRAARLG